MDLTTSAKPADEKGAAVNITVDRTKCSAIGLCEMTAPKVFQVDDDGEVHIAEDAALTDEVRDAVDSCPTAALSIEQ